MALSEQFVDAHTQRWTAALGRPFYPYRVHWPTRLFHHAPIENVASILNSGKLLSRAHSQGIRALDVAPPTILGTRDDAHEFCRLYFRPVTPTQFRIEGVRRPEEYYRDGVHAPTLAMLVFDAKRVLMTDGVHFSNGNMQSPATSWDSTEEFFSTIDFEKVYHQGSISDADKRAVILERCSEVLAPSPLTLNYTLRAVYCRSQAERTFLLGLLGASEASWAPRIIVSDNISAFCKGYTFVQSADLREDGLWVNLAQRSDGDEVLVQVQVRNLDSGQSLINYGPQKLRPIPPAENKMWRFQAPVIPGTYEAKIWLEGCLAFSAKLLHEEVPF